jgi:hypothetical protein
MRAEVPRRLTQAHKDENRHLLRREFLEAFAMRGEIPPPGVAERVAGLGSGRRRRARMRRDPDRSAHADQLQIGL